MSRPSSRARLRLIAVVLTAALAAAAPPKALRGQAPVPQRVAATESSVVAGQSNAASLADLRAWDLAVTDMTRTGELQQVARSADVLVQGRTHERLAQYHRGVRVYGADLTRQTNAFGQTVSLFGAVYPDIAIDVTPAVSLADARAALVQAGHGGIGPMDGPPELVVLPTGGAYRLAWTARVVSLDDARVRRYFIDATDGTVASTYDDTQTQTTIARGTGVVGDLLKLWVQQSTGTFQAVDTIRPGSNTTYDMKGNPSRTNSILAGIAVAAFSDIAADSDNVWTDGSVASAHSYAGLTYDYYRLRFGRLGLDGNNIKIRCFVNPTLASNFSTQGSSFPTFFNNAAYFGGGYVVFGSGSQSTSGSVIDRSFAAGIDIVAHELTHGVTEFTSNLIYLNESGALNEAFSDMMSAAVEFMWQPLGTGVAHADWLEGEDATPSGLGLRSFSDPHSLGDPDHYSLKLVTTSDNGGVHTNSNIVNHMYFLAIMGGRNRVSGLTVQGVGFDNRDQIERVIYRAFTQLLPASATFSTARAATIQAARDLYGGGSPAETAITQAWNSVGVQ